MSGDARQNILMDGGPVDRFCRSRVIYWIEAMSILEMVPTAISMLSRMSSFGNERERPNTSSIISDAFQFLRHNSAMIEDAPLQIFVPPLSSAPRRASSATYSRTICPAG
ncbi:hypothetical protein BJY04DRAFT_202981 [Aspergillus karnatakaensis]|uniref:uncharacterized protein n=1 Tax=Aspergillus karnatakaensis TaxID=1810916 RepID=UPI003CCC980B